MPITVLVTADPASSYLLPLETLRSETNLIVTDDREKLFAAAPSADVLLNGDFRNPSLFLETFSRATRLRWAHAAGAGVDSLLNDQVRNSPVPLTNGRGVFARPLGEWALGAMIFFAYQFRRLVDQQADGVWERYEHEELHGRTLAIVGYGSIGRAVGDRAAALGMNVLASSRTNPGDLDVMLAACDYLAITAPLTRETRGLITRERIARMKRSAVVINVGRGAIVDEAALVEALQSGKLRGAALDVFATEPLPAAHPFWKMPNVLLSPHTADNLPNSRELALEFFVENFARFRKGEPLLNVVDKHAGY